MVCEPASSSAGRPGEEMQRQENLGKQSGFYSFIYFSNSKPIFTPNSNNCDNNNKNKNNNITSSPV